MQNRLKPDELDFTENEQRTDTIVIKTKDN